MNKTPLFLVAVYTLLFQLVNGQVSNCGTELLQQQIDFENSFTDSVNNIILLNRTLGISVHVIEDQDGATNIDTSDLITMVSKLNELFSPIALNFRIISTENIENYHFNVIRKSGNAKDLMAQYSSAGTINLFLAETVYGSGNTLVRAFTYYPADNKDVIILTKQNMLDDTFIEQIGHLLNLYHTHETAFGNETVDESNCSSSGDLCCDTPADPGLSGAVDPSCSYSGQTMDANDDYYVPTTKNYMSSAPESCKCYLSEYQYIRVINCVLKVKNYLW